jgi:hypothetical protein
MFAKAIIITFAVAVLGVCLNAPATLTQDRTFLSNLLGPATVHAEEALKAGMVDPTTGKKIKYWAAPMDPTYIRNEPASRPWAWTWCRYTKRRAERRNPVPPSASIP